MGGGNPLKKVVKAVTRVGTAAVNPLGEFGDVNRNVSEVASGTFNTLSDVATGKGKRLQEEAQAAQAEQVRQQGIQAEQAENDRKRAAASQRDQARIAQGERSRTLLTGGEDLEDDPNSSISRRILSGR